MRIAIFGTGGAGGYFGAKLARAGEEVVFIARGEHLRAIREEGLRLETPAGEIVARSEATDDPARAGAVDAVLVGVKTWQLKEAARAMLPMLTPQTSVVPLQNGVEAAAELAAVLGAGRVLAGLCGTVSRVTAPGRVLSIGETNFIKFGEPDDRRSERVERLRQTFERAGVRAEVPPNIQTALWEKFIFIASIAASCGLARSPIGPVREAPLGRRLLQRAVQEVVEVATARGIPLATDEVARVIGAIDALPPGTKPSFLLDVEAGGATELDILSGAVSRYAEELRVSTPIHDTVTAVFSVKR